MKNTLLRTALCLAAASMLLGCHKHEAETPQSLDGVWEGPMSVSETGVTTIKILNVKDNETAEFYDMKYSLTSGYEILSKESSSIERLKGGTQGFKATVGGNQLTFNMNGDSILFLGDDEDSAVAYHLSDNSISYYKSFSIDPSLLPDPNDKEFTGPSKLDVSLQGSLKSGQQFTAGDFDWIEFLEWAGKTAATTAWGKGVGVLLDMLFPASGETTTLDDLLGKMDEISNQLAQMTILYKNTTYERYLNDRSKMVSELTNYNKEYYTRLSNAETDDEVKTIILDWASHNVGGNPVYVQGFNYIAYLLTTVIEQRDIFNMYDLYTYNTTAWESQGYAVREALRASDIATVAQTFYLTQLYHTLRDGIKDADRETILKDNIEKFEKFSEYIKNRPVERHEDRGICQIEGAHFVMDKYALDYPDYRNPKWSPIPCRWTRYKSDVYFMWGPNQAENYNKALTPDEVKRILDYYEGSGRTLYEIFNEDANIKLAARIVTSYYNGVLPLQSGYYSKSWRYVGVDSAVFVRTAKSASDIQPTAVGYACIDGMGSLFDDYLGLVEWFDYYDSYNWTRTNVIER